MDIFKDAVEDSAAKITKSFEKILIELIIFFMVIPRKINFTQMGMYCLHVEQTLSLIHISISPGQAETI